MFLRRVCHRLLCARRKKHMASSRHLTEKETSIESPSMNCKSSPNSTSRAKMPSWAWRWRETRNCTTKFLVCFGKATWALFKTNSCRRGGMSSFATYKRRCWQKSNLSGRRRRWSTKTANESQRQKQSATTCSKWKNSRKRWSRCRGRMLLMLRRLDLWRRRRRVHRQWKSCEEIGWEEMKKDESECDG